MVKTLRYFLLAALAMVSYNVAAEDIIWSEDFSSYAADAVPAGGDFNYACVGSGTKVYDQNMAGGTAPELLIGKSKGSFTVEIPLNGKTGTFSLSYMANYDRITVEPAQKTVTLGEKVNVGNNYTYALTVEAGTETVILTFLNGTSSNVRFDDAKLYQGEAKKPAGLSWGKASTSVTFGESYDLIPTLQNSNNLTITCTSSDETVATVTNEGVVSVVGPGETTITATFEGNDEYEAQTVSFKLTVKGALEEINVAKAIELAEALADGATSTDEYLVKGFVVGTPVIDKKDDGTFYGNAKFYMADEKNGANTIYAYLIKGLGNESMNAEDYIKDGDEVIVRGKLQKYVKDETITLEIKSGYITSLNGKTTGISEIANVKNAGAIFNLAGQRVAKSQKGIYIINGKKVVK